MLLFIRGHGAIVDPPEPPAAGADAFTWVFLVPAMNEEVVIADSVERLVALPVARKRIVVIDDASDDRTPEILAAIDHPDLFVLRRDKPDAQKGKAAGLNYAYRALRDARTTASGRSSSSSTPTAASTPRRRTSPPATSPTPRSAASSRWSGCTTGSTRWSGCRTSSSASTGTSSRPGATTGGRPGWAATASSTG